MGIYGNVNSGLSLYTIISVTTFTYENGGISHYSIYALEEQPESGQAQTAFFLRSSTDGSKKQFMVTIDDSGVLKATAIHDAT